jgi:plasmid stabilization system protein ParE
VTRFAAIGTYLANFHGEPARAAYTDLSRELERLARTARSGPSDPTTLFDTADGLFARMNTDCARASAQFLN